MRGVAAGRPLECVWCNELGGLTFALGSTAFVKWSPPDGVAPDPERTSYYRRLWELAD